MIDAPRQAPFAVRQLFDELDDEPVVAYPPLTRDELISLGDEPLLHDTDDEAWWAALDGRTRAEVSATAQRSLLARGLMEIDREDSRKVTIASRVRTVLALRSAPAFVTLVGNVGQASPALRCYGVLGPHERVAVLVEARIMTGVAEYLLCRPNYAATVITRFLLAPPDDADPAAGPAPAEIGGRMVQRRLELFAPGSLDHGRRYLASAGTTAGLLSPVDARGHAGQARNVTEASVAELVTSSWGADAATAFDTFTAGARP